MKDNLTNFIYLNNLRQFSLCFSKSMHPGKLNCILNGFLLLHLLYLCVFVYRKICLKNLKKSSDCNFILVKVDKFHYTFFLVSCHKMSHL